MQNTKGIYKVSPVDPERNVLPDLVELVTGVDDLR